MFNLLRIWPLTHLMDIQPVNVSQFSGVYTARMGAAKAAQKVADEAEAIATGDVSIEGLIDLNEQSTLYSLNLKLIKITDEMVGQVLDLFA